MAPKFEIVEAHAFHCGQMVRKLRTEHQSAIAKLGVNTHRELRRAFDDSSYRRALLMDGQLAGLGGVTGPAMAGTGTIWVAITQEATRYPQHIVRIMRRQLAEVMVVKRELTTFILSADGVSLRFARFIGFETIRDFPIEIDESKMVPMVIRSQRKIAYNQPAEQAYLH